MAKDGKVIITCAVTGAIHTPTMSEYLPLTPNEVAEDAIAAAEAGVRALQAQLAARLGVEVSWSDRLPKPPSPDALRGALEDEDDDEQNDAEAAAAAVPEDSVEVVAAECCSPEEDFKTEEAGKEEGEEEAPELDVEVADVNQSEAAPDID